MLFLLSIKIKLDVEKNLVYPSVGERTFQNVFLPYLRFEFKILHIENSKLAYETYMNGM